MAASRSLGFLALAVLVPAAARAAPSSKSTAGATQIKVPATPGALADALAKAASTAGDIELRLESGTHRIDTALVLTTAHASSGKVGRAHFQ